MSSRRERGRTSLTSRQARHGGGPASYFPSIEATYGRSIADWKADVRASGHTDVKGLVA